MGVTRFAVVVLAMSMVVLAFKCLPLNGLVLFWLLLRGRVLRIIKCVLFCCVIQVISLSVPTFC
jgi:hypothetical protein